MVNKLIHYLDVQSVSKLAKAHHLTAQVLQEGTVTWDKLIKRNCPFYEHKELPVEEYSDWEECYRNWVMERLSEQETNISHLTRILKMMENPKAPLLALLHVICERFPPVLFRPEENGQPVIFHLSCPCKKSHSVTHLGFLLLEKVEDTLPSAEQKVDTVFLGDLDEPWLSALESRASRQQRIVRKVEAGRFVFQPEDHTMEKLFSLQQNCQKLTFEEVFVWDDEDEEGYERRRDQDFWAQLSRALKLGNLGVHTVIARRFDLLGGRRNDLRAIWDAMAADTDGYSSFHVNDVSYQNSRATIELVWSSEKMKEKQWLDFQLILDKPPKHWPKDLKEELEVSEEEDSEDSE